MVKLNILAAAGTGRREGDLRSSLCPEDSWECNHQRHRTAHHDWHLGGPPPSPAEEERRALWAKQANCPQVPQEEDGMDIQVQA